MIETVEVVEPETVSQIGSFRCDFREVPVDALQEFPTNPRRSFDLAKLQELAQRLRSQGVLVPLIVRDLDLDRFEVVAGARGASGLRDWRTLSRFRSGWFNFQTRRFASIG
jgi:ribosomal protein S12 methylthiotransferase accessory factor YcaO